MDFLNVLKLLENGNMTKPPILYLFRKNAECRKKRQKILSLFATFGFLSKQWKSARFFFRAFSKCFETIRKWHYSKTSHFVFVLKERRMLQKVTKNFVAFCNIRICYERMGKCTICFKGIF